MDLIDFIFGLVLLVVSANAYFGWYSLGFNVVLWALLLAGILILIMSYLGSVFSAALLAGPSKSHKFGLFLGVISIVLAIVLMFSPDFFGLVQIDLGFWALAILGVIFFLAGITRGRIKPQVNVRN